MNEIQRLLALNMRRARERYGYSQAKLAELCKLSSNYISLIESGMRFPSADRLMDISRALGLKPHQLFEEERHGGDAAPRAVVTAMVKELRARLGKDIDAVLREYVTKL